MKLRGTMLTPGVSKNNRLYTPENIRKAHARLTERLAAGQPVTMLTHHAVGDDSTKIVAQVTAVKLNGDDLDYEAVLADTPDAATIGALVSPDKPFLRNVSIRGAWASPVVVKIVDGRQVETADDLDIEGLDFTKNPGVTGATVAVADDTATETAGRALITESVEARAVFTEDAETPTNVVINVHSDNPEQLAEAFRRAAGAGSGVREADKKPYGAVQYADPGYQSDKVKRYPIDTKAHAKAAWSYINQQDNAKAYTAAQLKRIKGRIRAALKKFGVTVTAESLAGIASTAPEVHMLTETDTTLSECYACVQDGTGTAGFSISAYNGPLTVTVSAYNGVEPADLGSVAMAAMAAACDAIHALDPDDDGDIDTGASSDETDDNQMESSEKEATVAEQTETTQAADTTETAEQQTAGTEAAETAQAEQAATITAEQLAEAVEKAVSAALAAREQAPATEETGEGSESGQSATESVDEAPTAVDEAALRARIRDEIIAEARKSGALTRKGIVETLGDPDKPLHEMSDEEFRAYQQSRAGLFFAHNPQ